MYTIESYNRQKEKKAKTYAEKKKELLICKYCKKTFRSVYYNAIYCSKDCWKAYVKINSSKRQAFYKLRFEVFKRDNFRCIYCGRSSIEDEVVLEIEHVVPRNGRKENWNTVKLEQLVTACRDCNVGKFKNVLSLPILNRIEGKLARKK